MCVLDDQTRHICLYLRHEQDNCGEHTYNRHKQDNCQDFQVHTYVSLSILKYTNKCPFPTCLVCVALPSTHKIMTGIFSSTHTCLFPKYAGLCYRCVLHTGWRRLIGSPKLQIIFHKWAIEYRPLLRKMKYKDKGCYASSPPCSSNADRVTLNPKETHKSKETHKTCNTRDPNLT